MTDLGAEFWVVLTFICFNQYQAQESFTIILGSSGFIKDVCRYECDSMWEQVNSWWSKLIEDIITWSRRWMPKIKNELKEEKFCTNESITAVLFSSIFIVSSNS